MARTSRLRIEMIRYKNPMEQRFGDFLHLQQCAGKILQWGYEGWRFRIGTESSGRTMWFTPDFWVELENHEIVIYEVKGHMREAARVRLGAFRDRYPFKVYLVKGGADGLKWDVKEF